MKQLLLTFLLMGASSAGTAQAAYPRQPGKSTTRQVASPNVYARGSGSPYAYHSSIAGNGLNWCSRGVTAVSVATAGGMDRRPCKKCY